MKRLASLMAVLSLTLSSCFLNSDDKKDDGNGEYNYSSYNGENYGGGGDNYTGTPREAYNQRATLLNDNGKVKVSLQWDEAAGQGVYLYEIYRSLNEPGNWSKIGVYEVNSMEAGQREYVDSTINYQGMYYYYINAFNNNGNTQSGNFQIFVQGSGLEDQGGGDLLSSNSMSSAAEMTEYELTQQYCVGMGEYDCYAELCFQGYFEYCNREQPFSTNISLIPNGETRVEVDWVYVAGEQYNVYRALADTTMWELVAAWVEPPYFDTLTQANHKYYYSIAMAKPDGESNKAGLDSIMSDPRGPQNVYLDSVTGTSAYFSWDQVTGATQYIIYNVDDFTPVKIGETTESAYRISQLLPSSSYNIAITAVGGAGNVSMPAWDTTTFRTAWASVANLSATDGDLRAVTLSWDALGNGTAPNPEYRIYRSINGTDYLAVDTVTTRNWADFNVDHNVVYYYKVQAVDGNGVVADMSSAVTGRALAILPPDSAWVDESFAIDGSGVVHLEWSEILNANWYNVYRKSVLAHDSTYELVTTVAGGTRQYEDASGHERLEYYYAVTAVDMEGIESSKTRAPTVAYKRDIGDGAHLYYISLDFTVASGQVTLNWAPTPSGGDTRYRIYRKIYSVDQNLTYVTTVNYPVTTWTDSVSTSGDMVRYWVEQYVEVGGIEYSFAGLQQGGSYANALDSLLIP